MKLTLYSAIFGEKDKQHSALAWNFPDKELIRKLVYLTDRPSHAPVGSTIPSPAFSGFAIDNYYVLAHMFPDLEGTRGGVVWTHTLIIDIADMVKLDRLDQAIIHLSKKPFRDYTQLPIIEIDLEEIAEHNQQQSLIYSNLYQITLFQTINNKSIVWIGEKGFKQAINQLWHELWPSARAKLTFRFSFGPRDLENDPPLFLYTPEVNLSAWHGYDQINPTSISNSLKLTAEECQDLKNFQKTLDIYPPDIKSLRRIRECWQLFNNLSNANLAITRGLVRQINSLSPNPQIGIGLKNILFIHLGTCLKESSISDIQSLRNLDINDNEQNLKAVKEGIQNWWAYQKQTPNRIKTSSFAELLTQVYFEETKVWWRDSHIKCLSDFLKNWTPDLTKIVFDWWHLQHRLIRPLLSFVPNNKETEKLITKLLTGSFEPQFIAEFQSYSVQNQWFQLHAAVCTYLYPPPEAIKKHLQFDKNNDILDGIREICERLPDDFLKSAVEIGENRLLKVAGELCNKSLDFIGRLDVCNPNWRKIWLYSIQQRNGRPWIGIQDPKKVLFQLCDHLLSGNHIEEDLLTFIAKTTEASLLNYPHSITIWNKLPYRLKNDFIRASAVEWIRNFIDSYSIDFPLPKENDLKWAITEPYCLNIINTESGSNRLLVAIKLAKQCQNLSESNFRQSFLSSILDSHQKITENEAKMLDELLSMRRWHKITGEILKLSSIYQRVDLVWAITQSYQYTSWVARWQYSAFFFDQQRSALITSNQSNRIEGIPKLEIDLLNTLTEQFSKDDIQSLCFHLDIDWEKLKGDTKQSKSRELIYHYKKRERLETLINTMLELRPDLLK